MWKSAGRAPCLRVLPWHLPYKWGKSMEKSQSGFVFTSSRLSAAAGDLHCYIYWQRVYLLSMPGIERKMSGPLLVTWSFHVLDTWVVPSCSISRLVLRFGGEHICVHWWIITWRWGQYISPKQWHLFNPEGVMNRYNFNPLKFCLNLLMNVGKLILLFVFIVSSTAELHLSGLIGTASHPDMDKIRIILFFFENTG